MNWKKLGLIFCPDNQFDWMRTHAAVPFAQHIAGNEFKVYFSTRDLYGKSNTGSVTFDIRQPGKILSCSNQPLLTPGSFGAFDEDGAMPSWFVEHKKQQYLYYTGWSLAQSVPFRNAIGLAIKKDEVFERISEGPIVDRGIYDQFFVANPCVLIDGAIWRMWYISCVNWKMANNIPRHFYNIKYAESDDGINWGRTGAVCINFSSSGEYAISRPCVIKDANNYKMWYSYRGPAYRIGYAESQNGIDWHRQDEKVGIDVSKNGWDSQMIEYPHVFDHGGHRYMLYNGNDYGRTGFGLAILEQD